MLRHSKHTCDCLTRHPSTELRMTTQALCIIKIYTNCHFNDRKIYTQKGVDLALYRFLANARNENHSSKTLHHPLIRIIQLFTFTHLTYRNVHNIDLVGI